MKRKTGILYGLLLSAITLIVPLTSKAALNASALSPMPTNVNTTNLTDSQVNSYYSGVSGKSGDLLVSSLYNIIKNHNEYDYDSATHRTILKIVDRNWTLSPLSSGQLSSFNYSTDNPYIRKLYGDYNNSVGTADLFLNPGASRVSFDKEHIWAQSLGDFGRSGGAGSDWHALWPSDIIGNQNGHSNYGWAAPTSSITTYNGDKGTYVGRNGYIAGSAQKVFEPLDQYKGDIARAMFYMPARYYVYVDSLHPKLQLVNGSPAAVTASMSQPGLAGDLATLLQWNKLDPVDDYEIKRNNLMYNNYQGNRNPFIDHPEWADIAYDTSYSGSGATTASGTSSVGSNPAWQQSGATLSTITVNYSSAKTSYALNEPFSTAGLSVTANYSNAPSQIVTSYTTSPAHGTTLSSSGTNTITVSYTENSVTKTATYNVTVSASTKTLQSISLNTSSVQKTFSFKEIFNSSNLVVTAHYSDSSTETLSSYNISTPITTSLGTQDVYVTHQDKSASYQVTITNQGASMGVEYAGDLIISEYIEGSSNNKAIEIYNGTGQTINLSGYSIKLYSNGAATPGATLNLTGSLVHNDVYVIANSAANSSILAVSDITSGVTSFNGDDTLVLSFNTTVIDCFGQLEYDPGTAWTNGAVTTVDKTLVRKATIKTGDSTTSNTFDPAAEWDVYPVDTTTYLGSHTMNLSGGTDYTEQAIAYGNFFLNETSGYCEILDGGNVNWTYLTNEYNYMFDGSKDYFVAEPTADTAIIDSIARYLYLIQKYSTLNSSKFIDDSHGVLLQTNYPSVTDDISPNYDIRNILIAFITFISVGLFFLSKKFIKKFNQ